MNSPLTILMVLNTVFALSNLALLVYNWRLAREWKRLHAEARKQLEQIEVLRARFRQLNPGYDGP
jgi:hypothetical protein